MIDTKYTLNAFEENYDALKVRTDHLYQIWAYVTNYASRDSAFRKVRGLLLYPAAGKSFHAEWLIQGHRLGAFGVNLNQEWPDIQSELLGILA